MSAALSLFLERGYHQVSVEDIVKSAGVGRITFYRHFESKADLSVELYKRLSASSMPLLYSIRDADYRRADAVSAWIRAMFERDRSQRELHLVFAQAVVDSSAFVEPARATIRELISELGARIPAFAVSEHDPAQRRQWLTAYLVLFEILDQSSHAVRAADTDPDPLLIDILTERFLAFVESSPG